MKLSRAQFQMIRAAKSIKIISPRSLVSCAGALTAPGLHGTQTGGRGNVLTEVVEHGRQRRGFYRDIQACPPNEWSVVCSAPSVWRLSASPPFPRRRPHSQAKTRNFPPQTKKAISVSVCGITQFSSQILTLSIEFIIRKPPL